MVIGVNALAQARRSRPELRTDLAETRHSSQARPVRIREATRLLIVASVPPQEALRLVPLAEAARASGFDPQIALLPGHDVLAHDAAMSQLASSGLPLYRIDPPARAGVRAALTQSRALRRVVQKASPQIIHAVGLRAVLVSGLIARTRGIAIVHSPDLLAPLVTRGTSTSWARRTALRAALAFVFAGRRAQVHVTTPEDRIALTNARLLDPRRSFLSRGIGIDLRDFHPQAAGEPVETPIVAFPPPDILGRDALATVVAVARRMREHDRAARFVLIGGQDEERISAETQSAMQAWQNEGLIEWWELADNLAETLRRVDIFCLPVSAGQHGAMPLLVAAAATGLTLIATDCAAFRDVIRHDLSGLLVPLGDVGALDAACAKALGDRAFRAQMGARAREIATAEFALDASITATLTMYHAALTPPSRLRVFARKEA